jgi:hypothetical protein
VCVSCFFMIQYKVNFVCDQTLNMSFVNYSMLFPVVKASYVLVLMSLFKSTSEHVMYSSSSVNNFPWSWVLSHPHCSAQRVKLKLACRVMRRQRHHI